FCNKCGTPFVESALFCSKCGGPRPVLTAPSAATPAEPPTAVNAAGSSTSGVESPTSPRSTAFAAAAPITAIGGMAGAGTLAMALPWQTIVAGETPDLRAMLSSVVTPTARRAVQASLRKPGLSLAATTVLDLVVAGLSGGTSAVTAAIPRAAAGGVSALLALVTGRKGGALRSLTGVVSLLTALVQIASLLTTLVRGLGAGSSLLVLAPMAIATGSALVMAVKTASVAFRRRS
ncbi:MAG: zinc ribbon domain-containing protein, partial [Coriobacteriia bacterium]